MYYVHTSDSTHQGYVRGCTVDAEISFFEDVASRRAYCGPVIGEQLHWILEQEGNEILHFESIESFDFSSPLLPEGCAAPAYTKTVTAPDCNSFGYTTHTCVFCGHSTTDDYAPPAHDPGEWVVMRPATAEADGLETRTCQKCGDVVEEKALVATTGCTLSQTRLRIPYKSTVVLAARVQPENAAGKEVSYTSSNEAVATVDPDGTVVAAGAGSATIACATADGFAAAECEVEVYYTFGQWLVLILLFGWVWY
jgi:hypothetical protein